MIGIAAVTTLLVALAELGDKTQMLSLLLATRYRPASVFFGVLIAVSVLQALATGAGRFAGSLVPQGVVAVFASVMFIGFGLWSFRESTRDDADEEITRESHPWGPVAATATAFFLAELGDKTQVMTFTVAADPEVAVRVLGAAGISQEIPSGSGLLLAVWLGSVVGMMLVNGAAIVVGAAVGRRFSRRVVARVSGVVFVLFGVLSLAQYLLAR